MQEKIVIVDEQDQMIGEAHKDRVHKEALLHRAFSVFVFRKTGDRLELLLQRRQKCKYHSGGLWSNTCCGHPCLGEAVFEAGQRRLREEMGIQVLLNEVGVFHYQIQFNNGLAENEMDHVLVGFFEEQPIVVNPYEVSDFCWLDVQALQRDLKAHPKKYTGWLPKAFALSLIQGIV
jgi:isopentenyl-diphosphate delta-isomerase